MDSSVIKNINHLPNRSAVRECRHVTRVIVSARHAQHSVSSVCLGAKIIIPLKLRVVTSGFPLNVAYADWGHCFFNRYARIGYSRGRYAQNVGVPWGALRMGALKKNKAYL